jgi:hypothetical protein
MSADELDDEDDFTQHRTQAEAIESAIQELRKEGGGTLTIHRKDCSGMEDCECDPVPVWVEGAN